MNWINRWTGNEVDWEKFAYKTALACKEESTAIEIVRCGVHAYEEQLQPTISDLARHIEAARTKYQALHRYLYDRPVPVNDAAMLRHSLGVLIILLLTLFMLGTSLVGNIATVLLFGGNAVVAVICSFFVTAFPVALGHLAYEPILSGRKRLQMALIILIALVGCAAYYDFGQGRRIAVDQATTQGAVSSYVDDSHSQDAERATSTQETNETKAQGSLGQAAFLIAIAAELALVYLVGLLVSKWMDEQYASWRELKFISRRIGILEYRRDNLFADIEVAKQQCAAGLRRAMDIRNSRRPPYYKALLVLTAYFFLHGLPLHSQQAPEHLEGILIDTSTSIANGAANQNLFQEYLAGAKSLLGAAPPSSRIWVSTIAGNSFGGVQTLLSGWTPEARGVFTSDVNRARRQLATSFEAKSAVLHPIAAGTDIFGGLWHLKTLFDSIQTKNTSEAPSRTVVLFSDMKNETREFPMPELLELGPERMLERATAIGFVVPLPHYKVYVYGASTAGLTPQSWMAFRRFWELYFRAAGAELVEYSTECNVQR